METDERFCRCRILCSSTKFFADWPIEVESVLLTCQLFMNTADGQCRMTIAECVVQLVMDNWPSHNAKRCITIVGYVAASPKTSPGHVLRTRCLYLATFVFALLLNRTYLTCQCRCAALFSCVLTMLIFPFRIY